MTPHIDFPTHSQISGFDYLQSISSVQNSNSFAVVGGYGDIGGDVDMVYLHKQPGDGPVRPARRETRRVQKERGYISRQLDHISQVLVQARLQHRRAGTTDLKFHKRPGIDLVSDWRIKKVA